MQKIWEILGKSMAKHNLTASAFSLTVIYRMRNHISDIFWEKALSKVDVEKCQDLNIYIKCNSAAWAQQIQLSRHDLLEMIKKDFPEKSYFNLKIYH